MFPPPLVNNFYRCLTAFLVLKRSNWILFSSCRPCLTYFILYSLLTEARGLDAELAGKAAYSFLDESAIHIQEVVESKTLLPIFENFCVLRSCEENLMFYIDVLEFRQINKKKHLKAKAREIYQKYL